MVLNNKFLKNMTQKNPYLINTNKLPETSTVSYYDVESDQNLTFEEWQQKQLNSNEIIEVDKNGNGYISEKAFNEGIAMYGPGWWDDWGKSVTKQVGSIALATTYFTPAVVVTGPLTAGAILGGGSAWAIGKATGDEDARKIGGFVFETGIFAAIEGFSGGTLGPNAPALARWVKDTCEIANEALAMKDKAELILRQEPNIPMEVSARERALIVESLIRALK